MVDSFWAVVLLGICVLYFVQHALGGPAPWSGLIQSVTWCTVIALRRRVPEKMLLLAAATGVFQLVTDVRPNPANIAMLVIIYSVAANGARWASRFALIGGLAAPIMDHFRWREYLSGWDSVTEIVLLTVFFALAWILGDSLRTRRAYHAELEERAARLEKEREAQSEVAVAAERARIARELHDVVAHNVSVMVVQADGAACVLDSAPEQCSQALQTVSDTGRQALSEMRRLLGVLRTGEPDGDSGAIHVPQPDVGQLDDLIEQVRRTGLPVDFKVQGTRRPLPSGVELTAYRIVQEALTNASKHGGPDVSATIRLTYGSDELDLLVEDDGRGAQQELYEQGGADGLGHGLIGMRERVGIVAGHLHAGPRPGGGFRISATLPLKSVG
jgi:signal transduction histidine kinase